jgi:hypothetical protein
MKDEPTQAEKRSILRQERSFNTLFGRAVADAALESQGRFSGVTKQSVVGATSHAVPKMPENNPWAKSLDEIVGIEPPLGYSVETDHLESVPVSGSLADEAGDADAEVAPKSPTLVEASASSTLSDEAEAERKAALEDRMLQIKGLSAEPDNSSPGQAVGDPQPMRASASAGSSYKQTVIRRRL